MMVRHALEIGRLYLVSDAPISLADHRAAMESLLLAKRLPSQPSLLKLRPGGGFAIDISLDDLARGQA